MIILVAVEGSLVGKDLEVFAEEVGLTGHSEEAFGPFQEGQAFSFEEACFLEVACFR